MAFMQSGVILMSWPIGFTGMTTTDDGGGVGETSKSPCFIFLVNFCFVLLL